MKTIMVAPLNWGLGHATRCIPIIRSLLDLDFRVLMASDGPALELLKFEFPNLDSIELPSYNIRYATHGRFFKIKMLASLPHIYKTMISEEKVIDGLVTEGAVDGIISDSRFGVRNPEVPSIYITHQLNVLSGSTSTLSTIAHQRIIRRFDSCWVPDVRDIALNHSGILGHLPAPSFPLRYFGIVSRLKKMESPIDLDILALLSGPEPQRTLLENKLKEELAKSDKRILLVRGVVETEQTWSRYKNIDVVNFMKTEELQETLNRSDVVISRSGYSTIMDLTILEKKAFFIPTPGQYEQEYLAKRLYDLGIAPFCIQKEFQLDKLNAVPVYSGLKPYTHTGEALSKLFSIFHGE